MRLRPRGILGLTLAVAAMWSCKTSNRFVSVGEGKERPSRDAGSLLPDGVRILADGAVFFFEPPTDSCPPGLSAEECADLPDGAVLLPDGRVLVPDEDDGGTDEQPLTCSVDEEDSIVIADVTFVDQGAFATAAGPTGYGLAYRTESGVGCGEAEAIKTSRIESGGALPNPVAVLDECNTIEDVSLMYGDEGWRLAWTDNRTNTAEVSTVILNDDLQLDGIIRTVTSDTPNLKLFEQLPRLARAGNRPLVAWIGLEEATQERRISAALLDEQEDPFDLVRASRGHRPVKLAAAALGDHNAAVAWVEETAERGIWLQTFDSGGERIGKPKQMTPFAAAGSTVDLATREEDGGAAVYSIGIDDINFEVRFRRLGRDGEFRGGEIKIVSQPFQATGASIARLGTGYVIAYRTRPVGDEDPEIRVVFVTKEGNVFRDDDNRVISFPVATASADGSQTDIQVSVEGQLLISWVDATETGNALRVIRRRLTCK